MSTIVTRAGKGSPLTHTEVDNNFTNLNTDKYQSGDNASFGTLSASGATTFSGAVVFSSSVSANTFSSSGATITGGTINGTSIGASTASTGRFSAVTNTALTSGRVTYAGTSGVLQDDADFTFNGTTVTMANDASISGLTVGKGGGADSVSTVVGSGALANNASGVGNSAFGRNGLAFNTTGSANNAFGRNSLLVNTTGSNNVAVGNDALVSNTTASNNTAVGYQAGYNNTTGANFVAIGIQALGLQTTASDNVAVGQYAGNSYTTNGSNTVIGANAGRLSTGTGNTFLGAISGYNMTTGSKNTILGRYDGNQNGLDIRTASGYIVLSDGDGNPRGVFDNSGNWLVGKTALDDTVVGVDLRANGQITAVVSANRILTVNRLTDDGTLVSFRQASTEEGTISVSGTTVSYNGGHLSRWSQLPNNQKDDTLLKGTVMSNLDDMCVWVKDGETLPNEQLNKMKVSDVEGDTNVAGVFVNWTRDEDCNTDDMNVAMTGDMIIRIAQGVVVQKSDLLMSAGDGTAKPQGDDIVRSKTIAKVTSNHVTCTYSDGSYCVPCVLMAC